VLQLEKEKGLEDTTNNKRVGSIRDYSTVGRGAKFFRLISEGSLEGGARKLNTGKGIAQSHRLVSEVVFEEKD